MLRCFVLTGIWATSFAVETIEVCNDLQCLQESVKLSEGAISPAVGLLQTHLKLDLRREGSHKTGSFKLTNTSKVLDSTYKPINSAGEHTGPQKVLDVVLIFVLLLMPVVVFAGTKVTEAREAVGKEPLKDKKSDSPAIYRTGSSYHMKDHEQPSVGLAAPYSLFTTDESEGSVIQNVLAGFSTAMAALPDAISFSFITGVNPLNGIWAGAFMGVSAALVGGRPGMVSSASAATAVVLCHVSLDPTLGLPAMALCVFIVGILQVLAGIFRLSRFITLIPHPVMLGFVNGLAIVMIRAQMRQYRYGGDGQWVDGHLILSMTITAIFTIIVAVAWSRTPVVGKVFPPALAAVIAAVCFSIVMKGVLRPRTLSDVAGARTFAGGMSAFPSWDFPPQGLQWGSMRMWTKVISTAVRFAIVGLLESLMTQALIDQITKTSGSMRRECFGQGVGNLIASMFGTQGGCALIAQSLMNVSSGGRSRVSGLTMGITLLLSVVILSPVMAIVPVAALVGLIVLIALNTFAWGSLQLIFQVNFVDAAVVIVTTVVTVWKDLATAVVIGLIINALGFAWHAATQVTIQTQSSTGGIFIISVHGPLFFGSAMNFQTRVAAETIAEKEVTLDFSSSNVLDVSGIEAIQKAIEVLKASGKTVQLEGLDAEHLNDLKSKS